MHKHDGDTHHHNSNTLFQGCYISSSWLDTEKREGEKEGAVYRPLPRTQRVAIGGQR
jgi:hypothetical protein